MAGGRTAVDDQIRAILSTAPLPGERGAPAETVKRQAGV